MAKRSPISGYNHNVRYRGLIFHVQTEDSGVMSPHLFTHLFREGVIISTRKLVYDAGSDEGAVKSLMQAQHKAVLKDLRKGSFDDKIDVYLAGTPGLLPRGAIDPGDEAGAAAERTSSPALGSGTSGELVMPPPPPPEDDAPTLTGDAAASVAAAIAAANAPPPTPAAAAPVRAAGGSKPQIEILDDIDLQLPRGRQPRDTDIEMPFDGPPYGGGGSADSAPVIMLDVGPTMPNLVPAPAATSAPHSDGVPTGPTGTWQTSRTGTGNAGSSERRTLDRIPAVSSASLPPIPTRVSTRPPTPTAVTAGSRGAMPAPVVQSRTLSPEDRARNESDAAEVYSPAPPSVEAPPGAASERPGQYSQHRRSQRISVMPDPRASGAAIPAGLGRPPRLPIAARQAPPPPEGSDPPTIRTPTAPPPSRPPESGGIRISTPQAARTSDSGRALAPDTSAVNATRVPTPPAVPVAAGRVPSDSHPVRAATGSTRPPSDSQPNRTPTGSTRPPSDSQPNRAATGSTRPTGDSQPIRGRTPTPARIQPSSTTRPVGSANSGGVVMTRPAVIVGAPAKNSPSQTRIRKAREDEGRGFGQGLISEKSLDEVILAYLSEDGDEK